jgi:cardiolipin synthase
LARAWREAIRGATRSILVESYDFDEDELGTGFRDLLVEKARDNVRVRVVRDWLGSPGKLSSRFWRPLTEAGGELRTFNPPRLDSPLGWLSRDHRKTIVVDGRVGFVAGLCISGRWLGDSRRNREPWRDTGVEICGPAVADLERAFAQVWAAIGPPLPESELSEAGATKPVGEVPLRVVASAPTTAGLFRLDQMIAALARERLWLTDAYFIPVTPYVEALRAAARDGVDVRILVPGASDLYLISALSRSGYRPLLEAGIRIFEWNGTMLHAKSAVADTRWARIGSRSTTPELRERWRQCIGTISSGRPKSCSSAGGGMSGPGFLASPSGTRRSGGRGSAARRARRPARCGSAARSATRLRDRANSALGKGA